MGYYFTCIILIVPYMDNLMRKTYANKRKKGKKKKKSCEVGLGRLISNAQLIYISLGVSIDGVNIYICRFIFPISLDVLMGKHSTLYMFGCNQNA
jgi:hypothetical protein